MAARLVNDVGIAMVATEPAGAGEMARERGCLAEELVQQPALRRDRAKWQRLQELRREVQRGGWRQRRRRRGGWRDGGGCG